MSLKGQDEDLQSTVMDKAWQMDGINAFLRYETKKCQNRNWSRYDMIVITINKYKYV